MELEKVKEREEGWKREMEIKIHEGIFYIEIEKE
jgi:hypothetical protein